MLNTRHRGIERQNDSSGRHCQLEQSEDDFRRFASVIHQVACDVWGLYAQRDSIGDDMKKLTAGAAAATWPGASRLAAPVQAQYDPHIPIPPNLNWPHRDGLKWPHRSGRGAVCRRSWRLAPEDAGGVAVELGEQVVRLGSTVRVGRRCGSGGCGRASTRSKTCRWRCSAGGRSESWSIRPEVLAPGSAPLDDGEVSWGDLALDSDLVAGVLGHPCGAPPLHSCDVQFRQGHRFTSRPGSGLRC